MEKIVGSTFTLAHGGGTTTYRIEGKHRDPGFFECVAIADGPENSHRFKGTLQVVSREDIIQAQRPAAIPASALRAFNNRHED